VDARSVLLKKIQPIVKGMRDAYLHPNNNSSLIVVEGDIDEIIQLPAALAELGYRLKGGIQLIHNVKARGGKRTDGVATFIHDGQFKEAKL